MRPYRPWPPERREQMSELHRQRLGSPDGCCNVYGAIVPVEHREAVRKAADEIRRKGGGINQARAAAYAELRRLQAEVKPREHQRRTGRQRR